MGTSKKVEFTTVDGLTLRGRLFPSSTRGPGIIMTPGVCRLQSFRNIVSNTVYQFNMIKEIVLPDVAAYYQKHGITVLTYDPRNYGDSDGSPRNQLDSIKHVDDYMDALTFLREQPEIDPSQVYFWGFSYSSSIALAAASLDRRVRGVVALCPWVHDTIPIEVAHKTLKIFSKDRQSQLKGNTPFYVPIVNENGLNPIEWGPPIGQETHHLVSLFKQTIAPNFEPRITLQSYFKILQWNPYSMIRFLGDTPALVVIPELDSASSPSLQLEVFESILGPKRLFNAAGCGHEDVAVGSKAEPSLECQLRFIHDVALGQFT